MPGRPDQDASAPWRCRHLFLDQELPDLGCVTISGEARHHLANVLRMRAGQWLILRGVEGESRLARIETVGRANIAASIIRALPSPEPPPCRVTVAQAPGKGSRFEEVLQHSVELGASEFVPLLSARSVPDWKNDGIEAKMRRWRAIIRGAAEQAKRDRIPTILPPAEPVPAAERLRDGSSLLLLCQSGEPLLQVVPNRVASYALFVGPEGGFTEEEESALVARGAVRVSIGPYVLRTETAAPAALAALMAQAAALGTRRH